MTKPFDRPKIRWPLDIRLERLPDSNGGTEELLILNCPLGISKAPLLLIPAVGPVIGCFDGNLSFNEILQKFQFHGLTPKVLSELIGLLDSNLFLDSPAFHEAKNKDQAEFLASSVRPAALAGRGYPLDSLRLSEQLEGYLGCSPTVSVSRDKLIGLVVPHIDYTRGHDCYGLAYKTFAGKTFDTLILIGTSHQYSRRLFHLTRKDFATPLGTLSADKLFIDSLAQDFGVLRSFEDEILHKQEHSLELQAPFVAKLNSAKAIVPILVGSFYEMLVKRTYPEDGAEYLEFIKALTLACRRQKEAGRSLGFVAGVDMAHVGQYFGDTEQLSTEFMTEVRSRDLEYLDIFMSQDKRRLFDHIAEDGDRRKMCGFPTLYTLLDLFDRLDLTIDAKLIDYRQAVNFANEQAVTFAGVSIEIK